MADDANPERGAEPITNLREAAQRIKTAMQEKSQVKPPDPPATEANRTPEPEAKPKAAEAEEPEPEAEQKPQPKAEGADVEESENKEPESSEVELADTPQGLAEQLGVPADQLMEHVKVTVKIDGVEKQVNLKELASGYQFESDYRNKTKALAEESRKTQETVKQAALERQRVAEYLVPLIQNMQAGLAEDAQQINSLLDSDPAEYLRQKAKHEQKQQILQAAQQEQAALAERQRQEFISLQKQAMAESERKLKEVFPEWKDVSKGRTEMEALRQYAKDKGVNPSAADRFFEAPFFEILWEAREYRKQQAAKPAALKKVIGIPKVQAPGASRPSEKPEVGKLRVATDRLRKTGHVRDGAAALKIALKARGVL